jgi:hypothetical protein
LSGTRAAAGGNWRCGWYKQLVLADPFEDPIQLWDGGQLVTLEDAAVYIQKLPKSNHDLEHWKTATEILIGAAEGRDFLMHARIAVLKALNHGKPAAPRVKRARVHTIIRS